MKKVFWSVLVSLLASAAVQAQSIKGTVLDQESNSPLIGAHVLLDQRFFATYTDVDGKFEMNNLRYKEYKVIVSYVGFKTDTVTVNLNNNSSAEITVSLIPNAVLTDEFIIEGVRTKDNSPVASTTISKDEIAKQNLGQDLPFLMNWSPSLVATSDAGAGVGYTGLRIRGSDQTRINVTVNGIPLNDAESQGVFWVNMPDFASSTENLQIQRGVGTSTNGAASFGASVNLETNTLKQDAYGMAAISAGSFETYKRTLAFGSGLMNNHWVIDGRFSKINSEGYIDRASSDLSSYYLSGGYYGEKTVIKAITFSGKERTYQSWFGTPQSRVENDEEGMRTHAANEGYSERQLENLLNSGRTYNFYLYDNEVDNYQQDHYQLHWSQKLNSKLLLNMALHYTDGAGYFEQFREDDDLTLYNISPGVVNGDTTTSGDVIRRRWLDNDFYGTTFSLIHTTRRIKTTLGGGYNEYVGDHFGEVIWSEFAGNTDIRDRFYDNQGTKTDGNVYLKSDIQISRKFAALVDLQARAINYEADGVDIDQLNIDVQEDFLFFNPKVGLTYQARKMDQFYGFFGIGNREPVRNDFVDAIEGRKPEHETMYDLEFGYRRTAQKYFFNLNFYNMSYDNQLVLTGELNDVGSSVRTNVDKSYRRGVEVELGWQIAKRVTWIGNATFSQNKIESFEEIVYDYSADATAPFIVNEYDKTDISFSPNAIVGNQLLVKPIKHLEVGLLTKYVGEQFLDNTSSDNKKLDAYLVNDLRFIYNIKTDLLKTLSFTFLVNNVFDQLYSSNGYTYSYIVGEMITENFEYPQAGRNFMVGLQLGF